MTAAQTLAERVEATIPGVEQLTRAEAAMRAVTLPALVDEEVAVRRVVAEIASEVFATGHYPANAADRVTAAREAARRVAGEHDARYRVARAVTDMRAAAREDGTGARLDVLRSELDEIVREAADADERLGEIETGADAIAAGPEAVAAWGELDALTARWQNVTAMHRRVLREEGPGDVEPSLLHRHGIVRDLHAHGWPGVGTDPRHRIPAYPHAPALPSALLQTLGGLRWAVRAHFDETAPGVRRWVPTRADLREAGEPDFEADAPRSGVYPVLGASELD